MSSKENNMKSSQEDRSEPKVKEEPVGPPNFDQLAEENGGKDNISKWPDEAAKRWARLRY